MMGKRSCIRRAILVVFHSPVVILGLHAPSASAKTTCPRRDSVATNDPSTEYRVRGDRCEGVYGRFSGASARAKIVGFHRRELPFVPFESLPQAAIAVAAPAGTRNIGIRAVSLRPRLYYAMDTDLPEGRSRFSWETSILSNPKVALKAHELALLACDNACREDSRTQYYPVEMLAPPAGKYDLGYEIVFQSDVDVLSGTVTVANVMAPKARTVPPQKLDDRFAAGWPIPVRLGRLQPGRYVVNLRATSSHGQLSEAYHIVIAAEGRNAGRGN